MINLDELTGVLVALVTPLKQDGSVDEAAVGRLIEHVLGGGVRGVLALGSTGESASLDEPARRAMLSATVKAAAGRAAVFAGVAQSHIAAAKREIKTAAQLGADCALVVPPFYYPIDQATVIAFYNELAERSPLPIFLYNIPQFTKVVAEPATVARLAHDGVIRGIKDSSRDFEYFEGVCIATRGMPKFRIFTGSDTMLLPSLAVGGAGTICGAANVAPHWVVRIFDDYQRGDLAGARRHQDELYRLVMALRGGVFPGAIKAALEVLGVCEPWLAPPAKKLDDSLTAQLREQLSNWGLLQANQVVQLPDPTRR